MQRDHGVANLAPLGVHEAQLDPSAHRAGEVAEDAHGAVALDDDQVDGAVVVQVPGREAAGDARDVGGLAGVGHELKPAGARPAVQRAGLGVGIVGIGLVRAKPHAAVGDVEVGQRVVVEVDKGEAEPGVGAGARHGAVGRHGIEEVAALVHEEAVALADEVGDEEVEGSALLDVEGHDSHAGTRDAQGVEGAAPERGVVEEPTVALVEPELVGHGIVGDVEVHVAVAVEVAGGHAEAIAVGAV